MPEEVVPKAGGKQLERLARIGQHGLFLNFHLLLFSYKISLERCQSAHNVNTEQRAVNTAGAIAYRKMRTLGS
jgi:hypothetical protein